MLVNQKSTPNLTVIFVTAESDTTFERRLNNLFSMRVPGLDIVLVAPDSIQQKLQSYLRQIQTIRTAKLNWTSELDLFSQAFSLCRGDYFHLSVPEHFIEGTFFENAVQYLDSNKDCNLVYCRPMFLGVQSLEPACPSILSTENYLQVTRAAISIYLDNQNNFELEGVIRASHLDLSQLRLYAPGWKKSLLFDLACKGYSHVSLENKLLIDGNKTEPITHDLTLLKSQLRSIWKNFDKSNHRWLLTMTAISHAMFSKQRINEPASRTL
jgi:hypothetical protein